MANITKIKGKRGVRYQYTLQVNGDQERRIFATKEEAEAALQDRQKEIREGRIHGVTPKPFAEMVEEYLAYKWGKGKRTVDKDAERLTVHMVPFFGPDTKTTEITAQRIAQYEQHRATAVNPRLKRTVVPATVNREVSILRCLLRLAKKWGYVREVPTFELAKESKGRLRFLEREEIQRLLDACRESQNPYLHAIVTIAVHTGMRLGEILGLTWDRVDFSRGVIVLVQTKGGEPRDVPMSMAVHEALSALRQERATGGGKPPSGLVFCKSNGTAWGQIRTAFTVALRKARITKFRFHDLRHTCASWLVMDGASLMEVKELLGHADLKMTLRYAHLAPERLREAVGRLDRVFSGAEIASPSAAFQQRLTEPASAPAAS